MNQDEQEALSKRYGNEPFCLLPLSSGVFAVISVVGRHLIGIAHDLEGVLELGRKQSEYLERAKQGYYVAAAQQQKAKAKLEAARAAKQLGLDPKTELEF